MEEKQDNAKQHSYSRFRASRGSPRARPQTHSHTHTYIKSQFSLTPMDALQSALARALAILPRPVQAAASSVGGAAFDVAMAGVEAGLVPDAVIRRGIQALLRQRDGEV